MDASQTDESKDCLIEMRGQTDARQTDRWKYSLIEMRVQTDGPTERLSHRDAGTDGCVTDGPTD